MQSLRLSRKFRWPPIRSVGPLASPRAWPLSVAISSTLAWTRTMLLILPQALKPREPQTGSRDTTTRLMTSSHCASTSSCCSASGPGLPRRMEYLVQFSRPRYADSKSCSGTVQRLISAACRTAATMSDLVRGICMTQYPFSRRFCPTLIAHTSCASASPMKSGRYTSNPPSSEGGTRYSTKCSSPTPRNRPQKDRTRYLPSSSHWTARPTIPFGFRGSELGSSSPLSVRGLK
mmetsp:Transcript_19278/g.51133  ORF Transcript_19278/g.51133 Transcript_19278/m.51133 type:complete len:233 (-) Transcript_19278:32-730(-)